MTLDCPKPFRYVTTAHKDITERLPRISGALAEQVKKVLDYNKAQRHLRGGEATKHKYERIAAIKNR